MTKLMPVLMDGDSYVLAAAGHDNKRDSYSHDLRTGILSNVHPFAEWFRWAEWKDATMAMYQSDCKKFGVEMVRYDPVSKGIVKIHVKSMEVSREYSPQGDCPIATLHVQTGDYIYLFEPDVILPNDDKLMQTIFKRWEHLGELAGSAQGGGLETIWWDATDRHIGNDDAGWLQQRAAEVRPFMAEIDGLIATCK